MDRTLWHLTHNPRWKLDPTYHPIWAYGATHPHARPAIFATDRPLYWNPWFGAKPIYAVRLQVPEDAIPTGFPEHPEYVLEDLDRVSVVEVIPLEEAIRRGADEARRGIPWDRQVYGGFGGVEDWWYACKEVWSDKKRDLVRQCRTRRGLQGLMSEWRAAHPGYKDPQDYYARRGSSGRLSGSDAASEAISLAKRAANYLYLEDPEFVQGGCSDVSEVLAAWLKGRGYAVEPVYGMARRGKKAWFMHAWLLVEGERFDPVLWVQDFPVDKYEYHVEPDVAKALRCDVEYIVEGEVEGLDRAFPE